LVAPERWPFAAPFILLWLLSPLGARWLSRPTPTYPVERLSPSEARILRSVARRTWRFFETLVGPADNHLPPDNLQEDPERVVAHRTSPTNIGLYLLSTAAARDFGWIGTLETVERLESTLASMGRLERFRGHFYNWYETRDLRPLEPRYVSTVDSGNLAGHLIVLGNACREMMERPLDSGEALRGIEDALILSQEAASQLTDDRRSQTVTRTNFDPARKIFSIGYRVHDGSLDPAAYDLLASEARLASFIAIAKGEVPASHWFRLARPMTPVELGAALVSWSGSMFEYLMPALIMD